MQKYLIVSLCVFAAFISIEAIPWYEGAYSDNGRSSNEYSRNGYIKSGNADSGNGVSGNGGSGNGGSGNGGSGYDGNGYESNGYGNSGNAGNTRQSYGNSRFDYEAYVPRSCPNCRVNNFGNGHYNTHTFYIPGGLYD